MYLKVETFEIDTAESFNWDDVAKENNMKEGVLYLIKDKFKDNPYPNILAYMDREVSSPILVGCPAGVIHTSKHIDSAIVNEDEKEMRECKDSGGYKGAALIDPQFVLDLIREVKK